MEKKWSYFNVTYIWEEKKKLVLVECIGEFSTSIIYSSTELVKKSTMLKKERRSKCWKNDREKWRGRMVNFHHLSADGSAYEY
jgi:hypothetical protein